MSSSLEDSEQEELHFYKCKPNGELRVTNSRIRADFGVELKNLTEEEKKYLYECYSQIILVRRISVAKPKKKAGAKQNSNEMSKDHKDDEKAESNQEAMKVIFNNIGSKT